jgi:hypothetical protein
LPIEFTSDESKKAHKTEEKYLYLRYVFLAVIGSSVFLFYSFAYNGFILPVVVSLALLAYVEYRRHEYLQASVTKEGIEKIETTTTPRKAETQRAQSTTSVEGKTAASIPKKKMDPNDILVIVAPAFIACAIISIAAYQSYQQQLKLDLGNSFAALLELSFTIVFATACIGLLGYIVVLLLQRHRSKRIQLHNDAPRSNGESNRQTKAR